MANYSSPTHVFDYNYLNNTITDITPTVANGDPADLVSQLGDTPSYTDRFLMLPTGQALFTAGEDTQLYVYTGTGPVDASSTPSISGITSNGSNSYTLTGSALNGAHGGGYLRRRRPDGHQLPDRERRNRYRHDVLRHDHRLEQDRRGGDQRGDLGQLRVAVGDQLAAGRYGRRAQPELWATAL